MNINGYGYLRFRKVGDKLLWNISIKADDNSYVCLPVTLKKDVEEVVKKQFKATKFTKEDKFLSVNVTKGFISGYKDKEKKMITKLVITELEFTKPNIKKVDKVDDPFVD